MIIPAFASTNSDKDDRPFLKYGNTLDAAVAWIIMEFTFELGYGNLENGYNIGKTAIEIGENLVMNE